MKKVIYILFIFSSVCFSQITKDDIREVLILEGYRDGVELQAQADLLYASYLDKVSYRISDLAEGAGYSFLSGLGLGAYESRTFGYKHTSWMPGFMQTWYKASPAIGGEPDYTLLSWEQVWREVDYASDRAAYTKLKIFFHNKWYLALLTHWIIKNTAATMVRDKMKYDRFFYSFKFDLVIPAFK
jgi:hypothetical protein